MTNDFPCYFNSGPGDSNDGIVSVELSEEECDRLRASSQTGQYWELDEDITICDIYSKVYRTLLCQEKQNLIDNPEMFDAWFSWEDDYEQDAEITDELFERYIDSFRIGITYPYELR